jgi:16S rRNA (uracil1498-N3)-methyltransferase
MTWFLLQGTPVNQEARLTEEETHHACRVFRHRPGDLIVVSDQRSMWKAAIRDTDRSGANLQILDDWPLPPEPLPFHIVLGMLKRDKVEELIPHLVELNVGRLSLVASEFSQRDHYSQTQWQRILKREMESRKQCGRVQPLDVQCLESVPWLGLDGTSIFYHPQVSHEDNHNIDGLYPRGAPEPWNLWIGPEGGWSNSEFQQAKSHGFRIDSLGPLVLRAQTAVYAASVRAIVMRGFMA